MPSVSKAQNRYVHALAARGVKWAQKWVREQHGHKVPNVERKQPRRKPKRRSTKSLRQIING